MKAERDHGPKEKRVTLSRPPRATRSGGGASGDSTTGEDKQDRNEEEKEALSKVLGWLLAQERAGQVRHPWRVVGSGAVLFPTQLPPLVPSPG